MQHVAVLQAVSPPVKKLFGLYPWLQFQEFFTRADWIKSFGIDLERVNEVAALAYLEGEAEFFKTYGDNCIAAIGGPTALAIKQSKLEKICGQFIHAASSVRQSHRADSAGTPRLGRVRARKETHRDLGLGGVFRQAAE